MRRRILGWLGLVAVAAGLWWWAASSPTPTATEPSAPPTPEVVEPTRTPRIGPRRPPSHAKPPAPQAPDVTAPEEAEEAVPIVAPDAPLTAMEHVAAGEAAFSHGDLESAYAHFLAVIEGDPDDPMAAFALYKLAWVEYNIGEFEAATHDMRLVAAWVEGSARQSDQMLAAAAAKDLARFEAEAADP